MKFNERFYRKKTELPEPARCELETDRLKVYNMRNEARWLGLNDHYEDNAF